MFYRIGNSWRLFRTTFDILCHDKELLVFPFLSGLASILLMTSFLGGMWGAGLMDELMQLADRNSPARDITAAHLAAVGVGLAFHFVNFFIMTYFNSCLVGAAFIRVRGGDPTLADGLRAANRRLPAIFGYSLIAASVGLILNALQERSRKNVLGRIAAGMIGMAWTLITFLVVPVLVFEGIGPVAAIKRSTQLLRQTWGEQITSTFGFGAIGFLFSLVGVLMVLAGLYSSVALNAGPEVLLAALGAAVVYWVMLAIVLSALRGIFTAALYAYVTNQEIRHRGFPVELVAGAFRSRD